MPQCMGHPNLKDGSATYEWFAQKTILTRGDSSAGRARDAKLYLVEVNQQLSITSSRTQVRVLLSPYLQPKGANFEEPLSQTPGRANSAIHLKTEAQGPYRCHSVSVGLCNKQL